MTYQEWERGVPECVRGDAVWSVTAYRLGLFLGDLCWADVTKLSKDRRTYSLADQLYRAASYISSNIAEGYAEHG